MRNEPYNIITSVTGFDFSCKIVDENGQQVKSGVIYSDYKGQIAEDSINKMINKKFWTNFNQDLFNKFLDYKRTNE